MVKAITIDCVTYMLIKLERVSNRSMVVEEESDVLASNNYFYQLLHTKYIHTSVTVLLVTTITTGTILDSASSSSSSLCVAKNSVNQNYLFILFVPRAGS